MSKVLSFNFKNITLQQIESLTNFCFTNKLDFYIKDNDCTGIVDVTGREIEIGHKVGYDFDDNTSVFTVVFEDGAYRKKYAKWNLKDCPIRPELGDQYKSNSMRYKIISK